MSARRWLRLALVPLATAGLGLLASHLQADGLRWRLFGPRLAWPTIEAYELHLDVTRPGRFEARATLELADVSGRRVTLLLNRDLRVSAASAAGQPVSVSHSLRLPSRYHSEGRVVVLELPAAPADGQVSLALSYAGEAASGREGPDWRGILYVDVDETRMCEQTVFYPQVPLSLEGPVKARAPWNLTVVAPREWELFAPAPGGAVGDADGARTWSFRSARAAHPALLGGTHERTETAVGGATIVTLLRPEHAALAEGFAREASRAIAAYAARFGPVDAGRVGVVEIRCRDSSYNWTAAGVMAFDRGALGGGVPVAKVAHEVAHLWWGQAVDAAGAGERFLTEGLAEYAAWTYLLDDGRAEEVEREVLAARRAVAKLNERGASRALAEVAFGVPDYATLAYDKGALVLCNLRAQLGEGRLDAALRRLVELGAERPVDLDDFRRELRRASGLEDLRVPWLDAPGDVALRLESARDEGGELVADVAARPVPADCGMPLAGTPVALELGGRGWSERVHRTLAGAHTRVRVDLGGRAPAYARLDPAGGWTAGVEDALAVLDGASLVRSEPGPSAPLGGTRLALEFDRALAPLALEELRAAQLAPAPDGVVRFVVRDVAPAAEGRGLVIETDPWLPGRRYRLDLGPLRDTDGLPVASHHELAVDPSTDDRPARIVATSPATGARVEAPGGHLELSLTFDEPMRRGHAITGSSVRAIERAGHRFPGFGGDARWDPSHRTVTFTLRDLEPGVPYAVPIRARSFRDLSGNGCEELDLLFEVTTVE